MDVKGIYGGYAFSRNPIVIRESFPTDSFSSKGGSFTVTAGGSDIYKGRFSPPLNIDISEIIDAALEPFPDADSKRRQPLMIVCDNDSLSDYNVICSAEYGGKKSETTFIAVPGGISKQNYRQLFNRDTSIFTERFFNTESNFFLTTRTASWRIVIKETELYPLYFITHRDGQRISVTEPVAGTSMVFEQLTSGVYALDLHEVRRKFVEDVSVLPNILDIYMDGNFSCRIVIEQSDISKERYRLKFRNSLGIFEILELIGELTISPAYGDNDDVAFNRYDSVTCDFYTDRERIVRTQSATVETPGVKRPDEIRFLMDMIGSEEVYLLDLSEVPVKVIPSIEEMTYRPQPDAPQKFTIKLRMADSETNIMQDIVDGSEGRRPRVFSKQFSKEFN